MQGMQKEDLILSMRVNGVGDKDEFAIQEGFYSSGYDGETFHFLQLNIIEVVISLGI